MTVKRFIYVDQIKIYTGLLIFYIFVGIINVYLGFYLFIVKFITNVISSTYTKTQKKFYSLLYKRQSLKYYSLSVPINFSNNLNYNYESELTNFIYSL